MFGLSHEVTSLGNCMSLTKSETLLLQLVIEKSPGRNFELLLVLYVCIGHHCLCHGFGILSWLETCVLTCNFFCNVADVQRRDALA